MIIIDHLQVGTKSEEVTSVKLLLVLMGLPLPVLKLFNLRTSPQPDNIFTFVH